MHQEYRGDRVGTEKEDRGAGVGMEEGQDAGVGIEQEDQGARVGKRTIKPKKPFSSPAQLMAFEKQKKYMAPKKEAEYHEQWKNKKKIEKAEQKKEKKKKIMMESEQKAKKRLYKKKKD